MGEDRAVIESIARMAIDLPATGKMIIIDWTRLVCENEKTKPIIDWRLISL